MRHAAYLGLFGSLLAVFLTGCLYPGLDEETIAREDLGVAEQTEVELLYYPYTVSLSRELTDPHPLFGGWTDIRMRFDTRRISRLGIDLLVVNVDPEMTRGDDSRKRVVQYRRFADYAAAVNLPFCLQADVHGLSAEDLASLLDWIVALNLQQSEVIVKRENRPLVRLLHADASLRQITHIGLSIEYESWEWATRWRDIPELAFAKVNAEETAIMIFAGLAPAAQVPYPATAGKWPLPRRDGKTLRHSLHAAVALSPARVVVASWNNFADGSFIQPNMLDGRALESVFQKALEEVREQD